MGRVDEFHLGTFSPSRTMKEIHHYTMSNIHWDTADRARKSRSRMPTKINGSEAKGVAAKKVSSDKQRRHEEFSRKSTRKAEVSEEKRRKVTARVEKPMTRPKSRNYAPTMN